MYCCTYISIYIVKTLQDGVGTSPGATKKIVENNFFLFINNVIVCVFGSSNEMNIINNHLCFVQELSLLVEEQERDGGGDVAVRLLAQSSPVPVRFYFGYALVIITVPVEFLFRNRYTFYLRTSTYFI